MSNLAYKYNIPLPKHTPPIWEEETQKKRTHKALSDDLLKKIYLKVIVYGFIFLSVGFLYINSVMQKTKYSIQLEKLEKTKKDLVADISKLKTEIDMGLDLGNVEKLSQEKLNMVLVKKINYIKFK